MFCEVEKGERKGEGLRGAAAGDGKREKTQTREADNGEDRLPPSPSDAR